MAEDCGCNRRRRIIAGIGGMHLKEADLHNRIAETGKGNIGLIHNLGMVLFKEYVVPFEISSVLFLKCHGRDGGDWEERLRKVWEYGSMGVWEYGSGQLNDLNLLILLKI